MENTQVIIYATLWLVSFFTFNYLFEKYEVMYHIFNFFEKLFKKDKSTNRFTTYFAFEFKKGDILQGWNPTINNTSVLKVIKSRKIYFGKNKGYYKTIVEPIK